ncbi:MAG: helix-turn-helix transcriptional regulator [Acidaminococcaceae bacterium]|nr:helix-turn-helix transcriptional regulator [Acidaminococcaceae bacterium]
MDKASIGQKIRTARLRMGLSQAEFAARIGTSEKTLSSWERGAYLVDVIMLNTIAIEAGLTLNDFTDTPSSGTESPHETKKRFTEAEKQLIEKIRCLRTDKKKALYVFFGVRKEK